MCSPLYVSLKTLDVCRFAHTEMGSHPERFATLIDVIICGVTKYRAGAAGAENVTLPNMGSILFAKYQTNIIALVSSYIGTKYRIGAAGAEGAAGTAFSDTPFCVVYIAM